VRGLLKDLFAFFEELRSYRCLDRKLLEKHSWYTGNHHRNKSVLDLSKGYIIFLKNTASKVGKSVN
jgi:hypothetical protein